MNKGLLSLIVPVYNGSRYLDNCLKSVLNQDYPDLEIICVNDGSTDNSSEILKKSAAEDSRIRIIDHDKNRGLLNARRTGVENASGEFIQFVDSDDTIDRRLCSSAVKLIQKHNTDIVQFSSRLLYTDKNHKDVAEPPEEKYLGQDVLLNHFVTMKASTSLVFKIYRQEICRKSFENIPDFHCFVGEDILTSFFISFFAKSYIGVSTGPKYNYYFGNGFSSDRGLPYDTFARYCEMNRFTVIVDSFLSEVHADKPAYVAAEHMNYRLILDCCRMYNQVLDVDKEQAIDCFWSHWGDNPYFAKGIMYALSDEYDVTNQVRNSKSYKLGNAIITPLKNIKSMLFPTSL